jgi:uncharacterized lipoprotein YmbA
MKNRYRQLNVLVSVAIALWLAGCASSPSARFYTLNPISPQEPKHNSPAVTNPVSISIAPVEIPDYLDRPQIVTRDGRNELNLAEFERWAGSLSDSIAAVLAENLSQLVGSDQVYVYPRIRAEKADYNLVLRVLRLDCTLGDQVLLKAQWTLFAGPDRKDIATRVSTYTERLGDKKYETMVAAVGRTLEQVSREIVREIPVKQ